MCHPSKIKKEFLEVLKITTTKKTISKELIGKLKHVYSMLQCLELNYNKTSKKNVEH